MKFNLNLDNINYIKIVYKDKSGTVCCTKAAIKNMNEREIFACAKFEDNLFLDTPQEVSLSFVCENGLYRTSTTLKSIENDAPYIFFVMKTPVGIEYQQNREYFRVKMDEDAIISFENETIPCKIHDISANGVRLILLRKVDIPEEVNLDLLFSEKELKIKSKFIRFDTEDNIPKVSFEFLGITDSERDFISQKCIQKQLEYKRSSAR